MYQDISIIIFVALGAEGGGGTREILYQEGDSNRRPTVGRTQLSLESS